MSTSTDDMQAAVAGLINDFRDYVVNGLPSSGANEPSKADIRSDLTALSAAFGELATELFASATGFAFKSPVVAASTANIAIASALVDGSTVDGVTVHTGDRVLLWNQTTASENGIYVVVASGAASRSSDTNTAGEMVGCMCYVNAGTANGYKIFALSTPAPITLGTTSLVFGVFANFSTLFSSVIQPLVDEAQGYAEAAEAAVGDVMGDVSASIGMNPVTPGVTAFGPNAAYIIGQATETGVISSVTAAIEALGSGAANIVILSGSLPTLTVVSTTPVTFLGTGVQTITSAVFGAVDVSSGQWIALSFPSGGATGFYQTQSGNSGHYIASGVPSGTQTWNTASNVIHNAAFELTYSTIQIDYPHLAPSLQASIDLANSINTVNQAALADVMGPALATFGHNPPTNGGGGFGGTAFIIGQATETGSVQSVTAAISVLGSGAANLVVVSGTGPNFTVVSTTPVTFLGTGLQTIASATFGTINIEEGQWLALDQPSGGVQGYYNSLSGNTGYYLVSGIHPTGTQTWNTAANTVYEAMFTVTYQAVQIDAGHVTPAVAEQLASTAYIAGQVVKPVLTYDVGFGTSLPSDWTFAGTWTAPSGGITPPAGLGDLSISAKLTQVNGFRDEIRVHRLVFVPQASGAAFAWGVAHNGNTLGPSLVVLDDTAHSLYFGATATAWSTAIPSSVASVTIAALTTGQLHGLEIVKSQRVLSATLTNLVTGVVVGTLSIGNNMDSVDFNAAGYLVGSPVIFNISGQTLFKRASISSRLKKPRVYICGDSLTEMPAMSGVSLSQRWADLTKQALGGSAIIGGLASALGSQDIPGIVAVELPKIQPDWCIEYFGTNDQDAGLSSFETAVNSLVAYCAANGVNLAVGIPAPVAGRTFTNTVAYLLSLPEWVRKIRFDLALTANHDGSTIVYGLHPTAPGMALMAAQVQLDVPELFY